MTPTPLDRLQFEDTVIDFAGHRLLRGGREQALEPKAFAVLALLAGAPGRVFGRDEILDAVWGHRHVTPGVLTRVMTLLRQALGEDAHHPRLLHTLHGVGYRFDLPAAPAAPEQEADPAADPGPAAAAAAAPGLPATDDARAPVAAAGTDAGGARRRRITDLPAPTRRRITDTSAPARRRRWPWLLGGMLVLALALVVLGSAPWWREAPSAPAADAETGEVAASPALVVMPLRPIGEGTGVRTLAEGLSEELICSLARIDGLRVIAHDSTRLLAGHAEPAAQAGRLGITHALEGNLQQSGQQLRVRLRMVDTGSGDLLWSRDFDRDATEALSLQRDIAEAVASSLTLELGLPPASQHGGDADFLRRYLLARMLAIRFDLPVDESVVAAENELRTLVRERPDDARAHAWLAVALRIRAHRDPAASAAASEEMVREAHTALRLDPARYEPLLVLAADDCRQRRWASCTARLEQARERAPGSVYVHLDHAWAMVQLGLLERAEAHARESLALDPLDPDVHALLARVLDARGRHDEAARHFSKAPPLALQERWFNAARRGEAAEALRLAHGFEAAGPPLAALAPSAVAVSRALADASLWPAALAEMRRHEAAHPGRMAFARLLAPDAAARADTLAAQLLASRGSDPWSVDLLLWSRDLAWLRRTPAFQAWLRDSGLLAHWQRDGFPGHCRPDGDGAACD